MDSNDPAFNDYETPGEEGGTEKPQPLAGDRDEKGAGVMSRSDLKMHERAIKERWEIPPETMREVPRKLLDTFRASENPKTTVAVARVLNAMVQVNNGLSDTGPPEGVQVNVYLPENGRG